MSSHRSSRMDAFSFRGHHRRSNMESRWPRPPSAPRRDCGWRLSCCGLRRTPAPKLLPTACRHSCSNSNRRLPQVTALASSRSPIRRSAGQVSTTLRSPSRRPGASRLVVNERDRARARRRQSPPRRRGVCRARHRRTGRHLARRRAGRRTASDRGSHCGGQPVVDRVRVVPPLAEHRHAVRHPQPGRARPRPHGGDALRARLRRRDARRSDRPRAARPRPHALQSAGCR